MQPPAVQTVCVSKRFPGVLALDDVSFEARYGEIHALCGENGAGKSTLIGILSGRWQSGSYEGELRIDGKTARFRNARDSQNAGAAVIHQELALAPTMSIEENIALGREPTRYGLLDKRRMRSECVRLMETLQLDADPAQPVSQLGVGQRQMVEIAKALARDAKILALDEPTSALTQTEKETLFAVLQRLKRSGTALIYISHRLEELFEIADRATVLRDGQSVGTWRMEELTPSFLVEKMIGRELESRTHTKKTSEGQPALALQNWSVYTGAGQAKVDELSLEARPGEILGLAGMMGCGSSELLLSVFGAWKGRTEGRLEIDGKPARIRSPIEAMRSGMALLTEDRKRDGLWLDESVEANLTAPILDEVAPHGLLNRRERRRRAEEMARRLDIRPPDIQAEARSLSGGNQQKTAIGKALMTQPRILLLNEPTRGVDVGAKAEIHRLARRLAEQGAAVLMASSDMTEILQLSDRILAMRNGRAAAQFDDMERASGEAVLAAAVGADARGNAPLK